MSIFSIFRRPPRPSQTRPAFEALEERQLLSTISGYVFNDANNNGTFQSGEPGINGSTLLLYKGTTATGTPIAAATSGMNATNGFYQFTTDGSISQTPTALTVPANFAVQSTGWTQTQQVARFDPSLGALQSIQIVTHATLQTEFGLQSFEGEAGTIGASVNGNVTLSLPGTGTNFALVTPLTASDSFNAAAYDPANYPSANDYFKGPSGQDTGIRTQTNTQSVTITNNPADPNAALFQQFQGGGSVTLSGHAGATSTVSGPGNVLSDINASAGAVVDVIYTYIPSNALKPGTYTILQTTTPPGYLPGLKSSGGTVIPNSANTNTITVTLAGGDATNNNFAELTPATVSGFVYADSNDNGIKDPTEAGIGGVSLTLTGRNDLGTITAIPAQTGADGSYTFGNLRPGTYTVTETTQPAGYLPGAKSQGTVIVAAATAPDAFTLSLGVSGASANNNIGKVQSSSLSGHVYVDLTSTSKTGLGGVAITLTGSNDLGTITPIPLRTQSDGSFNFGSLRPGRYTITEAPPSGYTQARNTLGTLNGAPAGTSPGTILSNTAFFVALGQSEAGVNYDFNELLPIVPPQVTTPKPPPPPTLSKILFLSSTFRGGH